MTGASEESAPVLPRRDAVPATLRQSLKMLHVIVSMAAESGGPPVVCSGLAAALGARGHHVTIATLEEPGKTPLSVSPPSQCIRFVPDGPAGQPGRYARSRMLDRWLRDHVRDFDIVHLHSIWQFPTFAAARACWQTRTPYVVLLNGMLDRYSVELRSRWLKRAYWLWRECHIENRAAGIHCLNRAEIRRAVPWISNMPKFVVGNGVDAEILAAMPERGLFRAANPQWSHRPLALFLSRLHPKKGLDRLIPAWKRVIAQLPEAQLLIAGTGDDSYLSALKKLVDQNSLFCHVAFLGQLVGPAKWQALVDADVFVLPSHQEGFSIAITEALAAGCVPVVTEECNFDELEPPDPEPARGIIVRGGDMTRFSQDVAALLSDASRRERLATAGKQLVKTRFTWQAAAMDLEKVYRHILAGKPIAIDGSDVWQA